MRRGAELVVSDPLDDLAGGGLDHHARAAELVGEDAVDGRGLAARVDDVVRDVAARRVDEALGHSPLRGGDWGEGNGSGLFTVNLRPLLPPWERATFSALRIFNRSTLIAFWAKHADSEAALRLWFSIVEKASWATPKEVREAFGSADFLADDRVVFDIKGNSYQLVVQIRYAPLFLVFIRFIGTHAEYDRIDATTIQGEATMIHPVTDKDSHDKALRRIEQLWNAAPGSPEADELDALATLVDAYERRAFPIPPPDPVEAIEARREQLGWSRKELEPLLGSRARVSEVLTRRRALTLAMIRRVHTGMGIPADLLITEPRSTAKARGRGRSPQKRKGGQRASGKAEASKTPRRTRRAAQRGLAADRASRGG